MIEKWAAYVLVIVAIAAFVCWFAAPPPEGISGDWRKWDFDSDPLEPQPKPIDELELV